MCVYVYVCVCVHVYCACIHSSSYLVVQFVPLLRQFLIPGFIDAHIHAPQYLYTGTGYDLELMDWLEKYTYYSEAKYSDSVFSDLVYRKVVVS